MKLMSKIMIFTLTLSFALSSNQTAQAWIPVPTQHNGLSFATAAQIKAKGMLRLTHFEFERFGAINAHQKAQKKSKNEALLSSIKYPVVRYENLPLDTIKHIDGKIDMPASFTLYLPPTENGDAQFVTYEGFWRLKRELAFFSFTHMALLTQSSLDNIGRTMAPSVKISLFPESNRQNSLNSNAHPAPQKLEGIPFPIPKESILTNDGLIVLPGGIVPAMVEINTYLKSDGNKQLKAHLVKIKEQIIKFAVAYNTINLDGESYTFFSSDEVQFMATALDPQRVTSYQSVRHALMYLLQAIDSMKNIFNQNQNALKTLSDLYGYIAQLMVIMESNKAALEKQSPEPQAKCFRSNNAALGLKLVLHPNDTPLESSNSLNSSSSIASSKSNLSLNELLGTANPFLQSSNSNSAGSSCSSSAGPMDTSFSPQAQESLNNSNSATSMNTSSSPAQVQAPRYKPSHYLLQQHRQMAPQSPLKSSSSSSSSSMDTTALNECKDNDESMSEK